LRFDFLIHVDFVTWLSIYFAVMLPALILTLAALLYRLLFVLPGAPFDWANFSPITSIFLCSGVFFATNLFLRNSLISDLLFTSFFLPTPALLRLHHASSDLPGHPTHPTL
jgi:hypothetical protein